LSLTVVREIGGGITLGLANDGADIAIVVGKEGKMETVG
jgi:hypothetical protein